MGSNRSRRTRPRRFSAGLYRMRVRSCTARYWGSEIATITLELESTNLAHTGKRAVVEIDWRDPAERARGSQIFALAGNPIEDQWDAEFAYKGMAGREFYVEVTRELHIHIQQLATTHRMTVPMPSGEGRKSHKATRPARF